MEKLIEKHNYTLIAGNIIKTGAKRVFAKNSVMSKLLKSEYFFKELLELFGALNSSGIVPQKFFEVVDSLSVSNIDKERLLLVGEVYEFYASTMAAKNFQIPYNRKKYNLSEYGTKNPEISERLKFLKSKLDNTDEIFNLKKSVNIEYKTFSDVHSEAMFVVEFVKNLSESIGGAYSDIGIFVDKTEARQKFLDLMKSQGIPVISSIYNEHYENLKHKVSVYQKISEICTKLGLEEFSSEDFKNISLESKSQEEILMQELDEVVKNLLYEIFEKNYVVDKVLVKQENSQGLSVLGALFLLWNSFSENEVELLVSEFGKIKNFYSFYKENKFDEAIGGLIKSFFKYFESSNLIEIVAGKTKSLKELQDLYDNVLKEKPDFNSFKEILEWLPPSAEKNAVTLSSISNKQDRDFKYVLVCGLTENNFPGANPAYPFISAQTNDSLEKELKNLSGGFDYFIKSDEFYAKQRFSDFCSLMKIAGEKIIFTTHLYESKKQVRASKLFEILSEADSENVVNINVSNTQEESSTISAFSPLNASGAKEVVVSENDVLKLNASAVSNYQQCPRKYYYKNLLNLKEPYSFAANYGSIVHSVMEVLHSRYLDSFNKDTALALSEILLNSKKDLKKTLETGFKESDAELLQEADELSIAEMQDNFKDAIEDLAMLGYFDEKPVAAVCEKSFKFKLAELPNVEFDGRIDAIVTYKDGVRIVDYKTGKNKINSLAYAISDNGVNFKTDRGKEPSNVEWYKNRYDYQIPLYYLACINDEGLKGFKDNLLELGLLYVRPKSKDNGCCEDFISAQKLDFYKEKIIQNLKENVIDKIKNETEFKQNKGWGCDMCAYKFLCDGECSDE